MRLRKIRWSKVFRLSGIAATATFLGLGCQVDVQAGPFADWWLNNSGNAYAGYPNTSYAPVLPAGLPQAQVGVLPTGAYASQYYRAPTTYYRPVTSFDPRLGTTVTSLQPCSSYQYQAQRVPLLVPERHTTAAYGGYGASPQMRYAPVMNANSNAGASGQSMTSIPSGLGSQYTAPVVQIPNNGVAMYSQSPYPAPIVQSPSGQPMVSGYGVMTYGPAQVNPNINYNTSITSPVASAVVPAAAWTTTTTNGGYVGAAPQQFSQPAVTSPYFGSAPTQYPTQQNSIPLNSTPLNSMAYGPGMTITPLGPPVISAIPINQNLINSHQAPAFGPMPGAMGSSVMPGAVYPNSSSNNFPSGVPNLRDSESSMAPQLPPTTFKPILPPPSESSPLWSPDVLPADILPDTESGSTRFQLRRVERDIIVNPSSQSSPSNAFGPSPFAAPNATQSMQKPSTELETPTSEPTPGLMKSPSLDPPSGNTPSPQLELKLESLKPIPAPPTFDASPAWRPVLLTPRDQTAGLPDRSNMGFPASLQLVAEGEKSIRSSQPPAPRSVSPVSIDDELNSNLVYFNTPAQSRKP